MAKLNKEREKAILKNMEVLGISREEAEELYAFDNDEIDCEEVEAIEAKAKENTKTKKKGSALDKVREMKAKKKIDASKEAIVNMVFDAVKNSDLTVAVQEMTGTKVSFMDTMGNYYSVAVTKHKKIPDGYKGV